MEFIQTLLMYIGFVALFAVSCYVIGTVFCRIYKPQKNKDEKPEKLSFSKKAVIVMFTSVILFVMVMTIIYCVKGGIPDALVEPFFGFFGIEGGALGIIKVSDKLSDKIGKRGKKK